MSFPPLPPYGGDFPQAGASTPFPTDDSLSTPVSLSLYDSLRSSQLSTPLPMGYPYNGGRAQSNSTFGEEALRSTPLRDPFPTPAPSRNREANPLSLPRGNVQRPAPTTPFPNPLTAGTHYPASTQAGDPPVRTPFPSSRNSDSNPFALPTGNFQLTGSLTSSQTNYRLTETDRNTSAAAAQALLTRPPVRAPFPSPRNSDSNPFALPTGNFQPHGLSPSSFSSNSFARTAQNTSAIATQGLAFPPVSNLSVSSSNSQQRHFSVDSLAEKYFRLLKIFKDARKIYLFKLWLRESHISKDEPTETLAELQALIAECDDSIQDTQRSLDQIRYATNQLPLQTEAERPTPPQFPIPPLIDEMETDGATESLEERKSQTTSSPKESNQITIQHKKRKRSKIISEVEKFFPILKEAYPPGTSVFYHGNEKRKQDARIESYKEDPCRITIYLKVTKENIDVQPSQIFYTPAEKSQILVRIAKSDDCKIAKHKSSSFLLKTVRNCYRTGGESRLIIKEEGPGGSYKGSYMISALHSILPYNDFVKDRVKKESATDPLTGNRVDTYRLAN